LKNHPYHFDLEIEAEERICGFFRYGVVWGDLSFERQLEVSDRARLRGVQSSSQRFGVIAEQVPKTSGSREIWLSALRSIVGC
jgi:hypothetical protein